MENKLYDRNLSTNLIDLIDPTEKVKIDEYLNILKCYKCNEVMIDPKMCQPCGYNICNKCKICTHDLTQSRHINTLLDSITFKCKFYLKGCTTQIKYQNVRKHLISCKYADEKILNFISNGQNKSPNYNNIIDSNLKNLNKNQIFGSEYVFMSSDKIYNTKINDYEGKIGVKCTKCESSYSNKNDFLIHFKNCAVAGNMHVENKDESLKTFYQTHADIQAKFNDFIFDKINENKNLAKRQLNNFATVLSNKKQGIINYEILMHKFNNDELMKEDPELISIIVEETKLIEEKRILIEMYNKKCEDFLKSGEFNDNHLKEELENFRNKLIMLEIEEKWAKEELESTLFIHDYGEKCTTCANDETGIKKYFCQNCRGKFCVDKCSKQCKTCTKFICPKDSKECKLCHKIIYCEACQKKCFFQGCTNTFCPECYKKNEHQARNSNTNCKFFTCERDQICDCLMTSMFCSKCEKRLCNNCLMKDKDHFPFLKA